MSSGFITNDVQIDKTQFSSEGEIVPLLLQLRDTLTSAPQREVQSRIQGLTLTIVNRLRKLWNDHAPKFIEEQQRKRLAVAEQLLQQLRSGDIDLILVTLQGDLEKMGLSQQDAAIEYHFIMEEVYRIIIENLRSGQKVEVAQPQEIIALFENYRSTRTNFEKNAATDASAKEELWQLQLAMNSVTEALLSRLKTPRKDLGYHVVKDAGIAYQLDDILTHYCDSTDEEILFRKQVLRLLLLKSR